MWGDLEYEGGNSPVRSYLEVDDVQTKGEMYKACNMHVGDENYTQNIGKPEGKNHLQELGTGGRILKCILNK
jgi:hypothetical protein